MKKILIINIDQNHRSIYSVLIAGLLMKKYPSASISIVVSSENDFFNTVNLFDHVTFIDIKKFFKNTQNLSNDQIEDEMRKTLSAVTSTEWDQVINLSANLLGSIFTCMLNAKNFIGAYAKEDTPEVFYSNLSAYILSMIPDETNNYFHPVYLYKDIIGIYYDMPIKASWEGKYQVDVEQLFIELLKKNNKQKIVLIDSSMNSNNDFNDSYFFVELYKKINKSDMFLPVFHSSNLERDREILNQLYREDVGEVNFITCKNKAQLSLVGNVSLVITDDLYMKSLADLAQIPSILLGKDHQLPLSDFSIVEKSHLVFYKKGHPYLLEVVDAIFNKIFKGHLINGPFFNEVEIYHTEIHDSLPLLVQANLFSDHDKANDQFAKWLLNLRYLAMKKKLDLPQTSINKVKYKEAIKRERQNIWEIGPEFKRRFDQGEKLEGMLGIEVETLRFSQVNFPSDARELSSEMKNIQLALLDFLVKEEATLGT